MNFMVLMLVLMALVWAYETVLDIVDYRSMYNPIPANVSDIYDAEKYKRWQSYQRDKYRDSFAEDAVFTAFDMALIAINACAWAASFVPDNIYMQALAVMALDIVVGFVKGCISSYIGSMVIEQKYGFNRMTMRRFVIDRIKELAVTILLECGLVCLFALIHSSLGVWTVALFSGVLVVFMFLLIFLYPLISKAFNKFRLLEDGELKERLTALLNKYGYKVKAIEVMQASERTTRSNAYFSGFGRTKTIVLYDNLLNVLTTDEIVAVFAHEMGHGLHRDTLRNKGVSIVMIVTLAAALFLSVSFPQIYADFGFESVNYAFAFVMMSLAIMPFISRGFSVISNHSSRKAEYRADRQAVEEGLGEELISALKKLADENFSNLAPSKLLVALEYSHPPLDARIDAVRRAMK